MKHIYKEFLVDEKTVDKRAKEITIAISDFKQWYCDNYDCSKLKIIEDAPRIISTIYHTKLNPYYSQLFYSKAKLPAIFGNALNFYASKVGANLSFKNYCASQTYCHFNFS